jgi:hypothetical protein
MQVGAGTATRCDSEYIKMMQLNAAPSGLRDRLRLHNTFYFHCFRFYNKVWCKVVYLMPLFLLCRLSSAAYWLYRTGLATQCTPWPYLSTQAPSSTATSHWHGHTMYALTLFEYTGSMLTCHLELAWPHHVLHCLICIYTLHTQASGTSNCQLIGNLELVSHAMYSMTLFVYSTQAPLIGYLALDGHTMYSMTLFVYTGSWLTGHLEPVGLEHRGEHW